MLLIWMMPSHLRPQNKNQFESKNTKISDVKQVRQQFEQEEKASIMTSAKPQVSFDQFLSVDIRVGTIMTVEDFPEARKPAWKLTIDFGPEIGVKKSSAQITDLYDAVSLRGRQVMAVVNFPPRQIGPFLSEVLTLGLSDADGAIVLLTPERPVPDGAPMH